MRGRAEREIERKKSRRRERIGLILRWAYRCVKKGTKMTPKEAASPDPSSVPALCLFLEDGRVL